MKKLITIAAFAAGIVTAALAQQAPASADAAHMSVGASTVLTASVKQNG